MFQTIVVQNSQISPFQPQTSNTSLSLEADGVSKIFWGPPSQRETWSISPFSQLNASHRGWPRLRIADLSSITSTMAE